MRSLVADCAGVQRVPPAKRRHPALPLWARATDALHAEAGDDLFRAPT